MIFLGIGSNLSSSYGDRFSNINLAISLLNEYGIKTIKMSSFYETYSHPNIKDPKFINVVISVKTQLKPYDLMSKLIYVEEKLERKRHKKNEPRTCDIDIIDYDNQIINFKLDDLNLEIPHKKLIFRNFVLFPMMEVYPKWIHPKTGESIKILIKKLPDEDRKSILKIKKN